MTTVTSKTKKQHDEKHMAKQTGKPEDTHPHRVHVRDYDIDLEDMSKSKFPKEHIDVGLAKYDGKYKGSSDKGYYFGFPQENNASNFVSHVNTNKYTHAEMNKD